MLDGQRGPPTTTPERPRGLVARQLQLGSGCDCTAERLLLGEVQREHGRGRWAA